MQARNRKIFRSISRAVGWAGALASAFALSACSKANYGCDSEEGRQSIVGDVDQYLSDQNCAAALALVEKYYPLDGCGTDDMRLARASANACAANVNFFQLVSDLGSENIVGSEMWVTFTKLFPSTISDQKVTGGQNALDALFAIKVPGSLTPAQYEINTTTPNPGTLVAANRTQDSNIYAMLVSMSLIGSLQNRYGAPDGAYHKTKKLGATAGNANGWEVPTAVDVNACTYAGAVMTFFDSITQVSTILSSSLGSSLGGDLTTAATTYTALFNNACDAGCQACGMAAGSCNPCPTELRNRYSCTGVATDKPTCAAAGLVNFIDNNALGWP
ncbi:MAG: hypothetical protein JST04_03080 [Bdellovibrionales bacterium]|nr:hypothetical protein [Bdellovibrionales bacterium]